MEIEWNHLASNWPEEDDRNKLKNFYINNKTNIIMTDTVKQTITKKKKKKKQTEIKKLEFQQKQWDELEKIQEQEQFIEVNPK